MTLRLFKDNMEMLDVMCEAFEITIYYHKKKKKRSDDILVNIYAKSG